MKQIYISRLQIATNTSILPYITFTIVRKAFRIVKHYALTKFDEIHCNNLEKWLSESGYSEKLVRKEILKARSQSKETNLDKEKASEMMTELLLILRTIRYLKTLEKLHSLLAPDEQQREVFTDILGIVFKNG